MEIPLTKPYFDQEEEKLVIEALRSGWVTQGPKIKIFEETISKYLNVPYVVAVNSCASALHLAMIIAEIGSGDEVICPSYTFIATPNCIEYVGAKPIFVDVDFQTSNIVPELIEEKITPRTKAILPVHQNGMACDIQAITNIANKYGLIVIEDAAYGIGVCYKGTRIGGFSPITCFSFHPRKAITTGEGGIFVTPNEKYAKMARILRAHGASISVEERDKAKGILYEHYEHLGYNYKMTELQAAMGIAQFQKIDVLISQRQKIADRYYRAFAECKQIALPYVPDGYTHTFGSFQIVLIEGNQKQRDHLITLLAQSGISSRRGIPCCHLEPYYQRKYGDIHLPVSERLSTSSLFLPMYPHMTEEEQNYVITNLLHLVKSI